MLSVVAQRLHARADACFIGLFGGSRHLQEHHDAVLIADDQPHGGDMQEDAGLGEAAQEHGSGQCALPGQSIASINNQVAHAERHHAWQERIQLWAV